MRELRIVLERAAAIHAGLDLVLDDWLAGRLALGATYDELLADLEGRLFQLLLLRFDHKPTHLARALAMNRATLRKRLRALGQNLPPDDLG